MNVNNGKNILEVVTPQANYKCKSCGFIAFDEEPESAKYKKCLGCGNIMGEKAPVNKTPVYKSGALKDEEKKTIVDNKNSLLISCDSCSQKFSTRAEACPKCGWKPKVMCQICQQEIPFDSTVCPECGDPDPFEPAPSLLNDSINENQKNAKKHHPKGFSWKSFLVAFLIAVFLNIFISAAIGVEPRKNLAWTAFWIYLSIESWKYWKWKALLPYPLFLIVSFALQAIVASTGNERLSWAYITIMLVSNIGGLAIFYMLFRKSQKQTHDVTS